MDISGVENKALELLAEMTAERAKLIDLILALQKDNADTKAKLEKVAAERLALLQEKEAAGKEPTDEPEIPQS